jgi:putative addiction module component (TIGR02574 family)
MSVISNRVTAEALALPVDQRASLVNILIESMNIPSRKKIDAAWAKEAEKRLAAVKAGKVKCVSGEDVFRTIREKFNK